MKINNPLHALLVVAGACLAGCAHHHDCCHFDSLPIASHPCHGYFGTCWRPWPGDCGRCPPPYYDLGYEEEVVAPLKQEQLPPTMPEEPALDSDPPEAPVVPPDEAQGSRRRTAANPAAFKGVRPGSR